LLKVEREENGKVANCFGAAPHKKICSEFLPTSKEKGRVERDRGEKLGSFQLSKSAQAWNARESEAKIFGYL